MRCGVAGTWRTLLAAASFFVASISAAQTVVPISSSSYSAPAVDFSNVIVPITDVKPTFQVDLFRRLAPKLGIKASFGTGFCLDPECIYVVTNYHVAAMSRPRSIKGYSVVAEYLDDGSEDHSASLNFVHGQPMVYSPKRDLALLRLWKPMKHHHGLAYSLDDLRIGQPVDIYSYPLEGVNPFRKALRFSATFQGPTTSGLLLFSYLPVGHDRIVGGASGGIVVDRKSGRIVGILSQGVVSKAPAVLAVPTQALVEFVSRVQPFLAKRIFPTSGAVTPFAGDLYPEFIPTRTERLEHRTEEPEGIALLRKKAQAAADAMNNFIAIGSFNWGQDNYEADVANDEYELRVIDGEQRFRKYPNGTKELRELPFLHFLNGGSTYLGHEWADLLEMVGTEYRLKIHRAPDTTVNGQKMKVFQYHSDSEDQLCPFQPLDDYLFFVVRAKLTYPPCYGEVWVDEDNNILRMSENLDLSAHLPDYKCWTTTQTVLTYHALDKPDRPRQIVPWTFISQGQCGKHVYWNRGFFRDYQEFHAKARLLATK